MACDTCITNLHDLNRNKDLKTDAHVYTQSAHVHLFFYSTLQCTTTWRQPGLDRSFVDT